MGTIEDRVRDLAGKDEQVSEKNNIDLWKRQEELDLRMRKMVDVVSNLTAQIKILQNDVNALLAWQMGMRDGAREALDILKKNK